HLAEVGVHHLDVPPPVGPARPGRRQLTDPDDAEVGGAHLVGRLAPTAGSHVERPEGGAHDLMDVLRASGGGNIIGPQHDGHGHILSLFNHLGRSREEATSRWRHRRSWTVWWWAPDRPGWPPAPPRARAAASARSRSGAGPERAGEPSAGLLPPEHPGWMNRLLGEQARDAFLIGVEVAQRLEALAADCPVRF